MLIRFNIKNFLSFDARDDGKSEEFSMIAGKVRNKPEHVFDNGTIKLLKLATVYGANASGKSNLIKAIKFVQSTIKYGLSNMRGYSEMYCKNNSSNKSRESYFEFEIEIDNKYYSYGFEVVLSESRFVSEWLVELSRNHNEEKVLFERDVVNKTISFHDSIIEKRSYKKIEVYAEDIIENESVLFLTEINRNKKRLEDAESSVINIVYNWIADNLEVHFPMKPISNYFYMIQEDNIDCICKMISAFGTGITSYEIVEGSFEEILSDIPRKVKDKILSDVEKIRIINNKQVDSARHGLVMRSDKDFFIIEINKKNEIVCKTIRFVHQDKNILFDLSEESDGTVRILDLLEILIRNDSNKVYVIDELDRCLHPSLTYKFIETFLEKAKDFNVQLIVTTHESRLMDFDLLRRDEIWFVNKDKKGKTDIYSLEEYNERFDKKIDKAYLEGRYGGVPIFSTVFPVKEE